MELTDSKASINMNIFSQLFADPISANFTIGYSGSFTTLFAAILTTSEILGFFGGVLGIILTGFSIYNAYQTKQKNEIEIQTEHAERQRAELERQKAELELQILKSAFKVKSPDDFDTNIDANFKR